MTLLAIRQQFCKISGRYDLATTDAADFDTDNGADFYIKAGQRMIDRMAENAKSKGRIFTDVAAGCWYLDFQNCRAVTEVWVNNDESRYQLEISALADLRDYYRSTVADTDQGAPKYYSPAFLRAVDADDITSVGTFFNHVKTDDDGTYNGVVIFPAPDEAYTVEIQGYFYQTILSLNTSANFWTVAHPDILVKAALYKLETFYRNTEGAKDFLSDITLDLQDLDKDTVMEDVAQLEEMEG